MTPVLSVRDLEIKYHTREGVLTALRKVHFDLEPGKILGVVGESGCGKSTVAAAVLRLLPANGAITAGQIIFQGQDLRSLNEAQMRSLRGRDISMIFQDPMTSLNPVFTVEEQMVDALLAHRGEKNPVGERPAPLAAWEGGRGEARRLAIEMLERVGIPDAAQRIHCYPHQFSGGMRQRILIATALLSNPALLVADEPTSALDVTLEAQIVDLIRKLRDELGTAILYITHDLGVVAQLCDAVMVMYAGSVVEAGDVFEIFQNPRHPYTRALLRSHPLPNVQIQRLTTIPGRVPSLRELPSGCKFAPRCDLAQAICHQAEPREAQVGGQVVLCHAYTQGWERREENLTGLLKPDRLGAPGEEGESRDFEAKRVVVETRRLRTYFEDRLTLLDQALRRKGGAVRAVDEVDLQVRKGETLALVGESGSGKTTLGRTILRLVDATGGEVRIQGQELTHLPQRQVRPLRARFQMIFQDPTCSLSPRKTVAASLLEPFQIHKIRVDKENTVAELLKLVGLSAEQASKYPHQLSGGQARRVGIARALALRPELLVADEPTAGLDVSVAAGVLNLLKDLREQLDLTYIMITHNLNVISFIADRVAVMYLGKIIELAGTAALFAQPRHPYTEALLSAFSVPDPTLRHSRQRIILEGEIPSPRNPPPGCPFHPRCRYAEARCRGEAPALRPVEEDGRLAACHFPGRVAGVRSG